MTLTVASCAAACRRAAEGMREAESRLNLADGQLGDGDTGQTMRRVAEAVAGAAEAYAGTGAQDIGALFRQLGMAGMTATGSSLGTLVSLGLVEIGKAFKGRDAVNLAELAQVLEAAETAMLARGGTALGDKTALDVLHAVREQLALTPFDPKAIQQAAAEVLVAFRDRPCRAGRARMYSERSIGLDDPGMLAFARLTEIVVGGASA